MCEISDWLVGWVVVSVHEVVSAWLVVEEEDMLVDEIYPDQAAGPMMRA